MKNFKIGQRVTISRALTLCKEGTVIEKRVSYVVKQDDGMAFLYEEQDLKPEKNK